MVSLHVLTVRQGVRPDVASLALLGGTSGQTPSYPLSAATPSPCRRCAATFRHPDVRSVCRCDRGSDPSVPELATEGLTPCRAPLHETPAPHSSDPKPPFRRCAASFPWQCLFLSVAVVPPFRRFRGSDPLLPAELRSVAHRVRPLSAPLLSVLVAGATEGLTHCRAPLHESPSPHRSERSPLSTFPAQKRTKPLEAPLNHPRLRRYKYALTCNFINDFCEVCGQIEVNVTSRSKESSFL